METIYWGGRNFKVPVLGSSGTANVYELEAYQVEVLTRLRNHAAKGFVDVGVNVGQTLLCLKAAAPEAPYIGFEPNPACVSYVRHLVRANGFEGIRIIPAGLHRKAGVLSLESYWDTDLDSTASLVPNMRGQCPVMRRDAVVVLSFDQVEESVGEIIAGMVRIDVEGGELEVVESMQGLLQREGPLVMVEVLPVYDAGNTERLERQLALEEKFRDLGYVCYRLLKNLDTSLKGIVRMTEIGVHDRIAWSNYLFVPNVLICEVERSFPCFRETKSS